MVVYIHQNKDKCVVMHIKPTGMYYICWYTKKRSEIRSVFGI